MIVIIRRGYKLIKCTDHPFANNAGYVNEHRLVAEQYLLDDNNSVVVNNKRYLSQDFAVHHIDFNRLNNDLKNLIIMMSNDHKTMHKKLYDKQYFLDYCSKFNLDPDTTKRTRSDFKAGCYKKYM